MYSSFSAFLHLLPPGVDNPLSRQYARRLAPFLYWFSGKDRGDIHHAATQKFRDARVKSTTGASGRLSTVGSASDGESPAGHKNA
jgi:hypothetical protein